MAWLALVVVVIVIGVLLYAVNTYIPINYHGLTPDDLPVPSSRFKPESTGRAYGAVDDAPS